MPGERPIDFAERMAREKATTAFEQIQKDYPQPTKSALRGSPIVLGADTIVVVEDEVLGKPEDADDAARMLRLLSGRKHSVTTAVCLKTDGFEDLQSETTTVQFLELSDSDITGYVASGEPMDKAGAYAIQGMASRWISKIEGDYNNVVGLPVNLVKQMLREHGLA